MPRTDTSVFVRRLLLGITTLTVIVLALRR